MMKKLEFGCWLVNIIIIIIVALLGLQQVQARKPIVPCYFIFGDSLVDSGNNNQLSTLAKANYPPYGVDFPGGRSTGRFTNGLTVVDFFALSLGFEDFIPPFASAKGNEILQGVNYASGSAGIRDETGTRLGSNICFNKQIENHKKTISGIVSILKHKAAATKHLRQCLYTVNIGNNDYINNYFKPDEYPGSAKFTPNQYADVLIQQFSRQLSTLYKLGARKVAMSGVGALGCIPDSVASWETHGKPCVEEMNDVAQMFNDKLKPLIRHLNSKFHDAFFIYLDNVGSKTAAFASVDSHSKITGCCQVGTATAGQCVPNQAPCHDRNSSYFFDSFHPTEAINAVTATFQLAALTNLLHK